VRSQVRTPSWSQLPDAPKVTLQVRRASRVLARASWCVQRPEFVHRHGCESHGEQFMASWILQTLMNNAQLAVLVVYAVVHPGLAIARNTPISRSGSTI
jgi:hypothetical protein